MQLGEFEVMWVADKCYWIITGKLVLEQKKKKTT